MAATMVGRMRSLYCAMYLRVSKEVCGPWPPRLCVSIRSDWAAQGSRYTICSISTSACSGFGQGLARLDSATECSGEPVGGVHAPRLAGQDRLLVVLRDVHVDEDLVHDVRHRADRHGEVDDAGGAVHAAVATRDLAADESLVRGDGLYELPHGCFEGGVFLVHDLEDRRRLVVLDEGVVLGAHRLGKPAHDVVVRVDGVHVEGDDFLGLALGGLHLVDGVNVRLGIRDLEGSATVGLVYAEDCLGRADGFVDHLLVKRHFYLRTSFDRFPFMDPPG